MGALTGFGKGCDVPVLQTMAKRSSSPEKPNTSSNSIGSITYDKLSLFNPYNNSPTVFLALQ